jgi:hypothetical protein
LRVLYEIHSKIFGESVGEEKNEKLIDIFYALEYHKITMKLDKLKINGLNLLGLLLAAQTGGDFACARF